MDSNHSYSRPPGYDVYQGQGHQQGGGHHIEESRVIGGTMYSF